MRTPHLTESETQIPRIASLSGWSSQPRIDTSLASILEIVKTFTGVGALLVAYSGLQTWRRQLYGTAEYERARRLYRAVLDARDQIAALRLPFISAGEMLLAFKDVYTAVLSHLQNRGDPDPESRGTKELREKHFKLLYDQSGEQPDEFSDRLSCQADNGLPRQTRRVE